MNLKCIPLLMLLAVLLMVLVGCGGGNQPSDSPTTLTSATFTPAPPTATPIPTQVPPTATLAAEPLMLINKATAGAPKAPATKGITDAVESKFTITSALCSDNQGPDCTTLRLGDDYLTNVKAQKEHLYSCVGKNPHAPGSREQKITWINFPQKTWDFFSKLWLPSGTFATTPGTYAENVESNQRSISTNNLPVDGKIGDWPMTAYPELTDIDGNPGVPQGKSLNVSYPAKPTQASSPSCVGLGVIGVTKNGVAIYNAADARGNDALAHEIIDIFGGHPAKNNYHYHFIPERLDNNPLDGGHSGLVGYINDGFPIYGYKGEGGVEISNGDLDLCHGHEHGALGYHYHATIEYPYTIGCYKGTPVAKGSNLHSGG